MVAFLDGLQGMDGPWPTYLLSAFCKYNTLIIMYIVFYIQL